MEGNQLTKCLFTGHSSSFQQQPGKLNLKNFAIVNDAIARMNVNSDGGGMMTALSTSASMDAGRGGFAAANASPGNSGGRVKKSSSTSNRSTFAPHHAAYTGLAGVEDQSDDDGDAEYAQVQELYPGHDGGGPDHQMYTFSQDTTPNKSKMRPRQRIGGMDKPGQLGGSKSLMVFVQCPGVSRISYSYFVQLLIINCGMLLSR